MSDNLEYYHNKGEQDANDRNYDPPHGVLDSLTTWSDSGTERMIEENTAYDQGYFHTRGQIDYGDNDYSPPHDSDAKEAYDEGWEAAKNS
jgi:hypothetical protein